MQPMVTSNAVINRPLGGGTTLQSIEGKGQMSDRTKQTEVNVDPIYESVTKETSPLGKGSEQDIGKMFNTFAKAIATELRYQSPDSPADTSQMMNTMLGMSSLISQAKSNQLMVEHNKLIKDQQRIASFDLVGNKVVAPGNRINFEGLPEQIEINIPKGHDRAKITIFDQSNQQPIFTESIEAEEGIKQWAWKGKINQDGKEGDAKPGIYRVEVEAWDSHDKEGKMTRAETFTMNQIDSVEFDEKKGVSYMVGDKPISLSQMKRLRKNYQDFNKLLSSQEKGNTLLEGISSKIQAMRLD